MGLRNHPPRDGHCALVAFGVQFTSRGRRPFLTGQPLADFRATIVGKPMGQLEYSWDAPAAHEEYKERLNGILQGHVRGDGDRPRRRSGRALAAMARNVTSFDAPALLLCYFPRFMLEPQWSDTGMWLQTVALLACARRGWTAASRNSWPPLRDRNPADFLGLDSAISPRCSFCGMAIGYRDPDAPVNNFERERVPLDEQVKFLGWDLTRAPSTSKARP